MFDVDRSAGEARRFVKMEGIYHRGQKQVWDGHAVLDDLWKRHGGTGLAAAQLAAAKRVIGSIMWGELAAWKVASQLADDLEPLEAKMAATSQAHDEARHFYVLHEYLIRACGDFPRKLAKPSERLLESALYADSTAKKLIGMQLQLESMALTIFHALREARCCPVLTDLLVYYEKDEARHVGLGMQLLPGLMEHMTIRERIGLSAYSFKVAAWSVGSLKVMEKDLRQLGVDPRRIAVLGKSKQMLIFNELFNIVPDAKSRIGEQMGLTLDAVAELLWPDPNADPSLSARARRVARAFRVGYEMVDTTLEPVTDAISPSNGHDRRVQ
jgi:hypothetical protein